MIWALSILCFLVLAQIAVKFALFNQVREVVVHAQQVLALIEEHVKVTDSKGERIVQDVQSVKRDTIRAARAADTAAVEAKTAREELPDKIIERLKSNGNGGISHDSGTIPTVKPPEGGTL